MRRILLQDSPSFNGDPRHKAADAFTNGYLKAHLRDSVDRLISNLELAPSNFGALLISQAEARLIKALVKELS